MVGGLPRARPHASRSSRGVGGRAGPPLLGRAARSAPSSAPHPASCRRRGDLNLCCSTELLFFVVRTHGAAGRPAPSSPLPPPICLSPQTTSSSTHRHKTRGERGGGERETGQASVGCGKGLSCKRHWATRLPPPALPPPSLPPPWPPHHHGATAGTPGPAAVGRRTATSAAAGALRRQQQGVDAEAARGGVCPPTGTRDSRPSPAPPSPP